MRHVTIGNRFEIWLEERWEELFGVVPRPLTPRAYQTMTEAEWRAHAKKLLDECIKRDAEDLTNTGGTL